MCVSKRFTLHVSVYIEVNDHVSTEAVAQIQSKGELRNSLETHSETCVEPEEQFCSKRHCRHDFSAA